MHFVSKRLRPALLTVLWSAAILAVAACGASSLPAVEERAAAETCTPCHGLPPPAPHVASTDCGLCHAGYSITTVSPALHENGTVDYDISQVACTTCHGFPPATTSSGATHTASTECGACHPGYTFTTATPALHLNGVVDLACGGGCGGCVSCHASPPATTRTGATHVQSTDCGLCHVGYTSASVAADLHENGVADWDISGVRCDYCHGNPPPAPHPSQTACGDCHTGYTSTTVSPICHLDGVTDCGWPTCSSCHGNPPASHVVVANSGGSGSFAACGACHVGYTATTTDATRHQDGTVEYAFGATSCNVCHGAPPPAPHPAGADCGSCHAGFTPTTVPLCHANPDMICLDDPLTCSSCHGNPPAATHVVEPAWSGGTGNFASCGQCHPATSLSSTGVTATHRNFVEDVALWATSCTVCHAAPPTNTHVRASSTAGGTGNFSTCATCHTGYTATTVPVVGHRDGTEQFTLGASSCNICHGSGTSTTAAAPPPAPHVQDAACGSCHSGYTSTTVNASAHRNGSVCDLGGCGVECFSCHGIPPVATHVVAPGGSGGTANFANCSQCHPATSLSTTDVTATHRNGVEDVLLGATSCNVCHAAPPTNTHVRLSSTAGGTGNFSTCATCHTGYTATTAPATGHRNGTEEFALGSTSCGICHGAPPPAPHTTSTNCGACHVGYTSTTVNPATHRSGYVCGPGGCPGGCGSCHGTPPADHAVAPAGSGGTASFADCSVCHAGSTSYWPNPATHQNGVNDYALAPASCTVCHAAPPANTHVRASSTAGGTGNFSTCGTCHTGYTATTVPVVGHRDFTEQITLGPASCGICHGTPPPAPHPARADCGTCHPGSSTTGVDLWTHRDGIVEVFPAVAAATPNPLDFGSVAAGASRQLTVIVANTGGADLVVSGLTACAATSGEFAFPASGFTLESGATRELVVTYAPTGAGTDSGCIALATNDLARSPYLVNVSGTGTAPLPPVISASPNPLDFGYQARWAGARSLALTVANTGGSTLSVTRVARCSGTSSEFSVSSGTFSIAPGGSRSVTVSYDPEDTGADTGCVELASNDPAQPVHRVAVAGTSVQPKAPVIRTNPTSLGFGTVTPGYSRSLTLTVSNPGNAALNVSGVARCSGTSDEFRVSSSGFSVSPGSSRQLSVTYRPGGAGTDSGCIAISSNDPARPRVEVPVSGTGGSGR